MKNQENQAYKQPVEKSKAVSVVILYLMAVIIVILGVAFIAYSFIYDVHFTVLTSSIHGAVFGTVVAFLGIRYFLSVRKLKDEVYKSSSKFSLSNFKIKKS